MRHHLPTLTAMLALSVSLSDPAAAQAPVPLWNRGELPFATPGPCKGQIPRGTGKAQDYKWKTILRDHLATLPASAFDFGPQTPVPETFDTGLWVTGAPPNAPYNTDIQCMADPQWSTVMPAVAPQIDELILHAAGGNWVDDGLVRMGLAPDHFLLSRLENPHTCRVHTPSFLQDPELLSWLNLSYDGNPYHHDPAIHSALVNRGLVWLVWNLILWDYHSWTDTTRQGAFPCMTASCNQPAAALSPVTGLVIPVPGVTYLDHFGVPVTLGAPNNPVQYHEESGGLLASLAGGYLQLKPWLPTTLHVPIEEALYRFADRIAHQTVWVNMANLNHRVLVALRLIAETQTNAAKRQTVMSLYQQELIDFYDPTLGFGAVFQPQGTFRDVGGFDVGYNKVNLLHLARLAFLDGANAHPRLADAARQSFDLFGHMIFPDPIVSGTIHTSPSAFNTRTPKGVATGRITDHVTLQGLLLAGAAGLPYAYAALERTDWSPHAGAPWSADLRLFSICSRFILHLHAILAQYFTNQANHAINFATPPEFPGMEGPFVRHGMLGRAYETPNFAFLFRGVQNAVTPWLAAANTALEELPFEHPVDAYYRTFDNAFFYAMPRRSDLDPKAPVALLHAGPVGAGAWRGFGGGQLSTLWNREGGPFILTRRLGNNGGTSDTVQEWRSVPIHAVSFQAGMADWTSSSRVTAPTTIATALTVAPSASDASAALAASPLSGCPGAPLNAFTPAPGATGLHVRVCGAIPLQEEGLPVFTQNLSYRRDFLVADGYVAVQTLLGQTDILGPTKAYEMIPLHYGVDDPGHHAPNDWGVELYLGATRVTPSPQPLRLTTPTNGLVQADRVVVTRYGGTLEIQFDQPELMGLSDRWMGFGGAESRNLLIEIPLPQGPQFPASFTPKATRYVMRTL